MGSQLGATSSINLKMNCLSLQFFSRWELTVQNVKDNLSYLLSINHLEWFLNALDSQDSVVMLLTTGGWVNCASVNNENVSPAPLKDVSKHIDDLCVKV